MVVIKNEGKRVHDMHDRCQFFFFLTKINGDTSDTVFFTFFSFSGYFTVKKKTNRLKKKEKIELVNQSETLG